MWQISDGDFSSLPGHGSVFLIYLLIVLVIQKDKTQWEKESGHATEVPG